MQSKNYKENIVTVCKSGSQNRAISKLKKIKLFKIKTHYY
jgi:hypothetical protein